MFIPKTINNHSNIQSSRKRDQSNLTKHSLPPARRAFIITHHANTMYKKNYHSPNTSSSQLLTLEITVNANTPGGNVSTKTLIDTSKLLHESSLKQILDNLLISFALSNLTLRKIHTLMSSYILANQLELKTNDTWTTTFTDYSNKHGNMVTVKLRY